ncbi:MAG: alpha/beta fold hydrolase [Anaerolineaceae bacterium]|nr:alpha/beta fold hydrolase [Anaerolineaceae bacterium]
MIFQILLSVLILAALYYLFISLEVMRYLPEEKRKRTNDILTIADAVKVCQDSKKSAWDLVALAQSIVNQKFNYSRRNPWDTPEKAFERGLGYCIQQTYALKMIYDRLDIPAKPVHAFYNYFPPLEENNIINPAIISGHAWLQVEIQGEIRNVCPGHTENIPGKLHFEILSEIQPLTPLTTILFHLGSVPVNAQRDRAARKQIKNSPDHSRQIKASAPDLQQNPGVLFRGETEQLDMKMRFAAPGQFVLLPDGWTHYEICGPENGDVIVLIHGFSVPYLVWDPTFEPLTKAGFRVLRFDLFGRGYSERRLLPYDLNTYISQLSDLLNALDIQKPVHLAAISMGAPIAAGFCAQFPDQVARLVILDPAGFKDNRPVFAKLFLVPIMGEIIMGLFGNTLLSNAVLREFSKKEKNKKYVEQYQQIMKLQGFKRALLYTLRFGPLNDLREIFQEAAQKHPVLLIWGKEDKTIPFEISQKALQAMPQAVFFPVEAAGHAPHHDLPKLVNERIIHFLKE